MAAMLDDPDEGVRIAAVHALTSRRMREAPPDVLGTGFPGIARRRCGRAAAGSLARYRQGLDPWVPLLLDLAEHDPGPRCT